MKDEIILIGAGGYAQVIVDLLTEIDQYKIAGVCAPNLRYGEPFAKGVYCQFQKFSKIVGHSLPPILTSKTCPGSGLSDAVPIKHCICSVLTPETSPFMMIPKV